MIFFLSTFFSLSLFLIEDFLGLGHGYHPDSLTYIEVSENLDLSEFLLNPFSFTGSFYYGVVAFLNGNVISLVLLNIFLFSVTNQYLYSYIRPFIINRGFFFYLLSLFVIFDPYRMHLSVHVLKDTFLIYFVVVVFLTTRNLVLIPSIVFGFLFRFSFFMYLPILVVKMKINLKTFFYLSLIAAIILFFYSDMILESLLTGQPSNMSFRIYDLVPNFVEFGYPYSEIFRVATWPFIRIFGIGVIFHPVYLPFALSSIPIAYFFVKNFRYIKFLDILVFFLLFAFFAFSVSGYNSFLRYTQPLIVVLSIYLIRPSNLYTIKNRV